MLSNPLRYAFDEASQAATQFAVGDVSGPPVADGEEPGLEGTVYYSPMQATFANGMHVAIVEIDPETAEITVLRYCVVHDCGPLINPLIVEGQVHGGVAQGVGGALYERMDYDENGQLLNASFMDFLMPYASEVPHDRDRPPRDPVAVEPAGHQGRGRGRRHPVRRGVRVRDRGRRGLRITAMPISPTELFELRRRHAAGRDPVAARSSGCRRCRGHRLGRSPRSVASLVAWPRWRIAAPPGR